MVKYSSLTFSLLQYIMPVTKKKGAIFPIYSDSPTHHHPVHPVLDAGSRKNGLKGVESPTKHRMTRAVLGEKSVRSQVLKGSGKGDIFLKGDKAAVENVKAGSDVVGISLSAQTQPYPSSKPKTRSAKSSINPTSTNHARLTKMKPKKAFEIFIDTEPTNHESPDPSTQSTKTGPLLASKPIPKRPSTPKKTSPMKKTRITGSDALNVSVELEDQENVDPAMTDSPASRTRSKTRSNFTSSPIFKPKQSGENTAKRRVPVQVLGDVSHIYGAIGREPQGFKEQGEKS